MKFTRLVSFTLSLLGLVCGTSFPPTQLAKASDLMTESDTTDLDEFGPAATRRKAERGLPSCQFQLGQAYRYGMGEARDAGLARMWFRRAAEQGYRWAQFMYGQMVAEGDGGPADKAEGARWLRLASDGGSADAMAALALALRGSDDQEAFRWALAAAQRDDARGKFLVALMLEEGQGTPVNGTEARRRLESASLEDPAASEHLARQSRGVDLATVHGRAKGNDVEAQYDLGMRLYDGVGCPRDRMAALRWLRGAAEQGHAGAKFWLYQDALGHGGSGDRKLLEQAAAGGYFPARHAWARMQGYGSAAMVMAIRDLAEHGFVPAQYELSILLQMKADRIKPAEALKWLRSAAEKGYANAQVSLGESLVVEGQPDEALRWLRQAADQGNTNAMVRLSMYFERTDPAESFKWLLAAANAGSPNMSVSLARRYAGGDGVPADPANALTWYIRAAEDSPENFEWNDSSAIRQLIAAHPDAPFDFKAYARWLEKAASWGLMQAQFELATLYRDGRGVPQDRKLAKRWFEAAANAGMVEARTALAKMADGPEALTLLEESVRQGDPAAMYALSQRLIAGEGGVQDLGRAMKLLRAAADHSLPEAKFDLGRRMVAGDGVPRDVQKGVYLVNQAAEHSSDAKRFLMDWLQGSDGPEPATVPFDQLVAAAEGGDPQAELDLSIRYRQVQTYAVDFDLAVLWARKAAQQGYVPAQFRLYELLQEASWRRGKTPDLQREAAEWLQKAARAGFPGALKIVAAQIMSKRSDGLSMEMEEVVQLLSKAAEQGQHDAMMLLGELLSHGEDGEPATPPPPSLTEARRWYLRAAEAGQLEAFMRLAHIASTPAEELAWQERALAAGLRWAAWPIADALLEGKAGTRDPQRAVALLEELGQDGDEHGAGNMAWERLGGIFEAGEEGIPKDLSRAAECYARGAEFTNAGPAFRLANLYLSGPKEIRNDALALQWILKAIDFNTEGGDGTEAFGGKFGKLYGNLANARLAFALRYEQGIGLKRDPEAAFSWYRRAAFLERKYPVAAALALLKASELREQGFGKAVGLPSSEHDKPASPEKWYEKAVQNIAKVQGQHLEFMHDAWERVEVQDIAWRLPGLLTRVKQAASRNEVQAQYDLAQFCRLGRAVPRNDVKARHWLELAAKNGHLGASAELGRTDLVRRRETRERALAGLHLSPFRAEFSSSERVSPGYRRVMSALAGLTRPRPAHTGYDAFVFIDFTQLEPRSSKEWEGLARRRGKSSVWAKTASLATPLMGQASRATSRKQAFESMRQAAELGLPEAQLELARYYQQGLGVRKNAPAAYFWYCLAAAGGENGGVGGMDGLSKELGALRIASAQNEAQKWWSAHGHI